MGRLNGPDGTPRLWINHAPRELKGYTEELNGIYIIAGAMESVRAGVEELTRHANRAGATSTVFDSLNAMIETMRERTYGRIVLMPDISLVPSHRELALISKARGNRISSIPIIIARDDSGEGLPANTYTIEITSGATRGFNTRILELLGGKK